MSKQPEMPDKQPPAREEAGCQVASPAVETAPEQAIGGQNRVQNRAIGAEIPENSICASKNLTPARWFSPLDATLLLPPPWCRDPR